MSSLRAGPRNICSGLRVTCGSVCTAHVSMALYGEPIEPRQCGLWPAAHTTAFILLFPHASDGVGTHGAPLRSSAEGTETKLAAKNRIEKAVPALRVQVYACVPKRRESYGAKTISEPRPFYQQSFPLLGSRVTGRMSNLGPRAPHSKNDSGSDEELMGELRSEMRCLLL